MQRPFSAIRYISKKWSFAIVGVKGAFIAEPSDPKRTSRYFRRRVSLDRSTHPPSFIRRAGCHTGLGFPGRCQLVLHTIKCVPCGVEYYELKSVWISHVQSGSGVSSECVKRILQDKFLQKWSSRTSEEEKFSSYKIYKDFFEILSYNTFQWNLRLRLSDKNKSKFEQWCFQ